VFVLPVVALGFAVFGVKKLLGARAQGDHTQKVDMVVGTSDVELIESGVPVVSDILDWIKAAASRLEIVGEPELMKVEASSSERSTFLRFASKGVHMNLWLSGPAWMGPFPRLCLADGNREANGIAIDRTAVAFEKAVIGLR